jgi:hypothetical protein
VSRLDYDIINLATIVYTAAFTLDIVVLPCGERYWLDWWKGLYGCQELAMWKPEWFLD